MSIEADETRDLRRCNPESRIEDFLNALCDTPLERCLVAAHPFGSVYVRRDPFRSQWQYAVLTRTIDGGPRWMNEQRIYPGRLETLLAESEVSIMPIGDYPHEVTN